MKTFCLFIRRLSVALIALLILNSAVVYAASYDTKITLRNGTYQPEEFLKKSPFQLKAIPWAKEGFYYSSFFKINYKDYSFNN